MLGVCLVEVEAGRAESAILSSHTLKLSLLCLDQHHSSIRELDIDDSLYEVKRRAVMVVVEERIARRPRAKTDLAFLIRRAIQLCTV